MFSSSAAAAAGRGGGEREDGEGEEGGEEWDGAQVVVLKEGRHLTADDVRRLREEEADEAGECSPDTTWLP